MEPTLQTTIEKINGIGAVFQKKLKKMGVRTVKELLFHFPFRYDDFSNIQPISKLKPNQIACVLGKILSIESSRTWKKKMPLTQAIVEDKSSAIKVVWFNQPYLLKTLKKGDHVCLAGKVSFGKNGIFFSSPAYEKIPFSGNKFQTSALTHTGGLIPVYPETEGLSSRWLRYILKPLLLRLKDKIPEILPRDIIVSQKLMPLSEALWQIHFPGSIALAEKAKDRFSFEELFLIELSTLKEKMKMDTEKAPQIPLNINIIKKFVSSLPFKLTNAQKKCSWQILKDMEKPRPMSRLLEGDVGSGKTIVAVIAGLNAVKAGYQVAFMAPTEILAKQHFEEVSKFLSGFKVRIAFLTGKQDKIISQKLKNEVLEISRNKLLERTKQGTIDILIGTHSLIQDKVKFANLGLCVIDEQHRFGIRQRAKLTAKDNYLKANNSRFIPHLLSMTATPIPRTLALTIYGGLDFSILNEMPKGRKKIITKIVAPKNRNRAYAFIRKKVKNNEQVFVICPRIESANLDADLNADNSSFQNASPLLLEVKAVKEEYEKLAKNVFPDLRVGILHGKMKTREKEKAMKDFKNKKIDILVSTSVVEVGVDIPQATIMMIEGAERFGLAQLYQFRGRVGRSNLQSYCFLFTDSLTQKTRQRLKAMVDIENGFELAKKDLEIRGPGSFYGIKQWGIPDLVMRSLKNFSLVERTRKMAWTILEKDPELKKYPLLKKELAIFKKQTRLA